MRLAPVVIAACAAALAASDSSAADDAPRPRPDAGKALRLALAPGKTYLYRFRETIAVRQDADPALAVDGITTLETRTEIVWDAGVQLQRVNPDGNVVVSLMPTRVHGSFTEPMGKPRTFDSDDAKNPVLSPVLGRGIRVTLSPAGRVVEAVGPDSPVKNAAFAGAGQGMRLARFDPVIATPFAQQFFQELPDAAPRTGLAWDATRTLAPDWMVMQQVVAGHAFGDAAEKCTVTKVAPETVTAGFRARGKKDVKRSEQPTDMRRLELADLDDLGDQLEEWLVLGEVRIRRDTGLVESRTSTTTLETHANAIRVPGDKIPRIPGVPAGDIVGPASDRTHEISSQLDLVDVR